MKIAIIDDEQQEREYLGIEIKRQLSDSGYKKLSIEHFPNAETFLSAWTPGQYTLILLDIYMDSLSGIDAARKIREQDKEALLVFCTSSNEFASESYEVNAQYYLHKPVSSQNISEMLSRLKLEEYEYSRYITLPDGQNIFLRNIIYTEYYNHVVTIYNKKGSEIQTRISQTDLERLLLPYSYFHCCTKGIVVNFYEVVNQTKNIFTMSNGKTVYLSRRKEKEVLDAYTDFCFGQIRKELLE